MVKIILDLNNVREYVMSHLNGCGFKLQTLWHESGMLITILHNAFFAILMQIYKTVKSVNDKIWN